MQSTGSSVAFETATDGSRVPVKITSRAGTRTEFTRSTNPEDGRWTRVETSDRNGNTISTTTIKTDSDGIPIESMTNTPGLDGGETISDTTIDPDGTTTTRVIKRDASGDVTKSTVTTRGTDGTVTMDEWRRLMAERARAQAKLGG